MPIRLIRDGILTSQRVNQLTPEEEIFFRRLMSHVDDYGLAEAHLGLLRAALYPLRLDRVREAQIAKWLQRCAEVGVIGLYEVDGVAYLQIINFKQQTRSKPKHPLPTDEQMKTFVSRNKPMPATAHLDGDVFGDEDVVGDGQPSGRPKSIDDVRLYAKEIGLPETEAEAFFDHFEANGWKQGGRAAIKSWPAALRNWQRRAGAFGKKSSNGVAGAAFDPSQPNAHTGGLPVMN